MRLNKFNQDFNVFDDNNQRRPPLRHGVLYVSRLAPHVGDRELAAVFASLGADVARVIYERTSAAPKRRSADQAPHIDDDIDHQNRLRLRASATRGGADARQAPGPTVARIEPNEENSDGTTPPHIRYPCGITDAGAATTSSADPTTNGWRSCGFGFVLFPTEALGCEAHNRVLGLRAAGRLGCVPGADPSMATMDVFPSRHERAAVLARFARQDRLMIKAPNVCTSAPPPPPPSRLSRYPLQQDAHEHSQREEINIHHHHHDGACPSNGSQSWSASTAARGAHSTKGSETRHTTFTKDANPSLSSSLRLDGGNRDPGERHDHPRTDCFGASVPALLLSGGGSRQPGSSHRSDGRILTDTKRPTPHVAAATAWMNGTKSTGVDHGLSRATACRHKPSPFQHDANRETHEVDNFHFLDDDRNVTGTNTPTVPTASRMRQHDPYAPYPIRRRQDATTSRLATYPSQNALVLLPQDRVSSLRSPRQANQNDMPSS